jgi:hypothetical protein
MTTAHRVTWWKNGTGEDNGYNVTDGYSFHANATDLQQFLADYTWSNGDSPTLGSEQVVEATPVFISPDNPIAWKLAKDSSVRVYDDRHDIRQQTLLNAAERAQPLKPEGDIIIRSAHIRTLG